MNDAEVKCITTTLIVIHNDCVPLLKSSLSVKMPSFWHTPGGVCDVDDPSILMGIACALWEEAGLHVSSIADLANKPWYFRAGSGKKVLKLNFIAEAKRAPASTSGENQLHVRFSHEHADSIWDSLEEVKSEKCSDMKLLFTGINQSRLLSTLSLSLSLSM